jgi:hypothetical protein
MDIGRLLFLSGLKETREKTINESHSERFNNEAKKFWDELVVGSEEIFVDFEEFYSYVNSEYNIDSGRVMAVKNVMDEFANLYNTKGEEIGLEIDKGGKEAILAVNKGLDELDHGDFEQGLKLITVGYNKAKKSLVDFEGFVEEYSNDILDSMSYQDDPMGYNGVSSSNFI